MAEIFFHEIADIFPMMTASEFAALKRDIQENGLLEPIELYEGKVIDGRNRYRACYEMLRAELIPIPIAINIDNDESMQIQGTDILINSYLRLQVKCDYDAGDRKYGGTGNIFLQTEECNPYKFV
jgi:hypothetical protein